MTQQTSYLSNKVEMLSEQLLDSDASHRRANERNAELKGNCTSLSTTVD